jgi:glycosyltransferase involved in cell wall biosynthesis
MAGARMAVAIVEPVGAHGGMDCYDHGLCEGLARAGVSPVLYTCDASSAPRARSYSMVAAFRGAFGRAPRWLRGAHFLAGALRSMLDVVGRRIPVVHYHFFQASGLQLLLLLSARAFRRKTVVTVHDVEQLRGDASPGWLARMVYRQADALIVHNDSSRQALRGIVRDESVRIATIPHGNYLHCYGQPCSKQEARARLGLGGDLFVLLFFGQIKRSKGLDILLDAIPQVVEALPSVHLVIAGREADVRPAEYQELVRQRGLERRCTWKSGYIENGSVPTYFRAADLVILPYRRIYQSGVLLLAMSLGVPALVSSIPGMLELVEHGRTGFVFESGDAASLAQSLKEIAAAPGLLDQVAGAAFAHVRDAHSWTTIGQQTRTLYEQMLRSASPQI